MFHKPQKDNTNYLVIFLNIINETDIKTANNNKNELYKYNEYNEKNILKIFINNRIEYNKII